MSALCRRLMVETGFDPEGLKRKGKVIRDLAIERGWDREKFACFDQSIQDRVSAFTSAPTKRLLRSTGVSAGTVFPRCGLPPNGCTQGLRPRRSDRSCDLSWCVCCGSCVSPGGCGFGSLLSTTQPSEPNRFTLWLSGQSRLDPGRSWLSRICRSNLASMEIPTEGPA